jgi:hypothetical protein
MITCEPLTTAVAKYASLWIVLALAAGLVGGCASSPEGPVLRSTSPLSTTLSTTDDAGGPPACRDRPAQRPLAELDGATCPSPLSEATVACRYEPDFTPDNPTLVSGSGWIIRQYGGGLSPIVECVYLCGQRELLLSDGDQDPNATQCLITSLLYDQGCPEVPARRIKSITPPDGDPFTDAIWNSWLGPGSVDAFPWCTDNAGTPEDNCGPLVPGLRDDVEVPQEVQGCGCDLSLPPKP